MATLATQPITRPGIVPTYAAVTAGGDKFKAGDHTFLSVKNGNGSACVVTVVTPGTEQGLGIADLSLSVAAGANALIGPLPAGLFRATDGFGSITYSVSSSVTIAVLSI